MKEGHTFLPIFDSSIDSYQVCPTFHGFNFTGWSLEGENEDEEYSRLNESISASQDEREKQAGEMAFDAFAVPEPVDCDYRDGDDYCAQDMDMEPGMEGDNTVWSERAVGHAATRGPPGLTATLAPTPADLLSVLTSAPLEYSYFDHGKPGAWAGPKHWKLKPLTRPGIKNIEEDGKSGRKKKVIEQLAYEQLDDESEEDVARYRELLGKPKKSVKLVEKTMKGWNREKHTLPEDLHYSGHELVRLKCAHGIVVAQSRVRTQEEVEDVGDYDYDNPGDNDGYCPDIESQEDDYVEPDLGVIGEPLAAPNLEDLPIEDVEEGKEGGEDMELVQAPKLVDKAALQIGYAKTAKKVDMKRIKSATWKILTQASSEDKENQEDAPEHQEDIEANELPETSFQDLYKTLKMPGKLPKNQSENLSVPLAFIALLHLCNEQNLALESTGDEFKDFTISRP